MSARIWLGIAAGGALGSLCRATALETPIDPALSLLVVNVFGSFVLGVAAARLVRTRSALLVVGTGFCGGLTSLSTFAVDVAHRIHDGNVSEALGIAVATMAATCCGAALGLRTGRST